MKRRTAAASWVFCALATGAAVVGLPQAPYAGNSLDRYVQNDAFGVGEYLRFSVGYGIINAGTATMQVGDLVEVNGRPVYRIMTTATSNSVFDAFYPVRDTMLSLVDAEGLFTWRYEKHMREGDYRKDQVVRFLQDSGIAIDGRDTVAVVQYVQDVLSALYYVRTQELNVGESLMVPNMTDKKSYDLEVRILEKERIKTPAGEFDCVKVEPLLQAAGIFKHEGRITVWMTDDRLHMPVLMKSKIIVGSIRAELTGFQLGELWGE